MIILDANVVSEPMKPQGNPAVRAWPDRQSAETLYLTATRFAELLFGVASLPAGRRRDGLEFALADLVARLFGLRILPFDQEAARAYTGIVARARAAGRGIGFADGQIAAIAAVHGFAVATRDTGPFRAAGLTVINPWEQSGREAL